MVYLLNTIILCVMIGSGGTINLHPPTERPILILRSIRFKNKSQKRRKTKTIHNKMLKGNNTNAYKSVVVVNNAPKSNNKFQSLQRKKRLKAETFLRRKKELNNKVLKAKEWFY